VRGPLDVASSRGAAHPQARSGAGLLPLELQGQGAEVEPALCEQQQVVCADAQPDCTPDSAAHEQTTKAGCPMTSATAARAKARRIVERRRRGCISRSDFNSTNQKTRSLSTLPFYQWGEDGAKISAQSSGK
jgi:hypothetical protein